MFDHEKLDVYRVSVEFVAWAYHRAKSLEGPDRHARDQLLRASQSIPLNIAEGNGKLPSPDRLRSWRIALGSALECAAMLTRMTHRDLQLKDEATEYECESEYDSESGRHK
jgi:four helix bundle protein